MAKKAASRKKRTSSKKRAADKGIAAKVKATATSVVDELENASDVVLKEVRDGLAVVTDKASKTAKSAADTQAAHLLKGLIDEIEETGETLLAAVGRRLDQLRGKVAAQAEASGGPRKK